MKNSRHHQCAGNAEFCRNRVKSGFFIEFKILTGVNHVKSRRPHHYDQREQNRNGRINRAAHGNPGGSRRDCQRPAQNQMRESGKAFGVGIKQNAEERDRR